MRTIIQDAFQDPEDPQSWEQESLVVHKRHDSPNINLVVFVHGFGGHRYGSRSSWGQFPKFIYDDFPNLDIGLYSYRTRFGRLKFWRSVSIEDEAEIFAQELRALNEYKRIILIGHSQGGLLSMATVAYLINTRSNSQHAETLSKISGLFLMASPQLGSLRVSKALSFFSYDLRALRRHGDLVQEINSTFTNDVHTSELGDTNGKVRLPMWAVIAASDTLVDRLSANVRLPAERTLITHGLHGEIVKPKTKDALGYTFVRDKLRSLIMDSGSVVSPDNSSKSSASTVPIWNLPWTRDLNFTGRQNVLQQMNTALHSTSTPQVLNGLGGVGKTRVALEYAYKFSANYRVIWWINSESQDSINSDYFSLISEIEELKIKTKEIKDPDIVRGIVRRWFEENPDCLIVFDNANHPRDIEPFLPRAGNTRTIITSLNPFWESIAQVTKLDCLTEEESIQFVQSYTKQSDPLGAEELSKELGYLPLALKQAAAYISERKLSIGKYVDLFRERRRELWSSEEAPFDYERTVATAWDISIEKVRQESRAAEQLQRLYAYYGATTIPIIMASQPPHILPEEIARALTDEIAIDEALRVLQQYSLFDIVVSERQPFSRAVSTHRLLQTVVRDRLAEVNDTSWLNMGLRYMNGNFPERIHSEKEVAICRILLPHALDIVQQSESAHVALPQTSRLLSHIGNFLMHIGRYYEARTIYERELTINVQIYPSEHPEIATVLNNLAAVNIELDNFSTGYDLAKRALAIGLSSLEPTDPKIAMYFNHLGVALLHLGDLTSAKQYLKSALDIYETLYGKNSIEIVGALNNYASVLWSLQELYEAKELNERALSIVTALYGSTHPEVATSLNNLSTVIEGLGDLPGAQEKLEQAIAIARANYGDYHPILASYLRNLSHILTEQNEFTLALKYAREALKIDQAIFEPDHGSVAQSLSNLGGVLRKLNQLEEAEAVLNSALESNTKRFGTDHKQTAIVIAQLGIVDRMNGNRLRARQRLQLALDIFNRRLPASNPLIPKIQREINLIEE